MLVHKQQVRLTQRERQVLLELTGQDPSGIRTREELRDYAEAYLTEGDQDAETLKRLKAVLTKYLMAI
ncbi:hypothetical protein ACTXGQ_12550 [Marinobacter sp. 1Y8]